MDSLLKNNLKKSLIKTYSQDFSDIIHVGKYVRMEEVFTEDTYTSSVAINQNKECSPKREERTHQHSRSPF